jgi:orotate phosphoribosyltransferase
MNEEEVLDILKETGAIKEGHFRLSSGLHADTYFQCAIALESPGITEKMGDAIARRYEADDIDTVVSPAIGGIVLGFAVALALGKRFIWAERENGLMAFRRGFTVSPGDRVLIVEDVVTTGGSVREVVGLIKKSGADVAGIACLINRGDVMEIAGTGVKALVNLPVTSFPAEECSLCREGKDIESPGSRLIKK